MHSGSPANQAVVTWWKGDSEAESGDGDWRAGIARLSVIVLALTAVRLAAAGLVPLTPDEAYYWYWSRFPSLGYFDHPPMVAWWIWLSTALFGNLPFGVRAISVLAVIPLSAAVYATGLALFDRSIAQRAVLWTNASLLLGVGGILATPDMPSLLFWTLAILSLALLMRTQRPEWWLAIGLFAGFGVLSKFTDLFLGVGLLAALLAFRHLRRWLATLWPWLGGVVALFVALPLLFWNAGHDWVTFSKQFGRIARGDFDVVGLLEYLGVQFLLLNPFVAVFVGMGLAVWLRRCRESLGMAVLVTTALPLVLYFFIHSFHGGVQGNWPAPIYPTLALVAAAVAASVPDMRSGKRLLAWCRDFAFPFGVAASLIGLAALSVPAKVLTKNPADQFYGWGAFANAVEIAAAEAGAGWIGTIGHSTASELTYHLREGPLPVLQIVGRQRHAFAPPPDPALLDRPALIVESRDQRELLMGCFDEVTQLAEITRETDRLRHYNAYLVSGADRDLFEKGC